jgi:hypothetical protein
MRVIKVAVDLWFVFKILLDYFFLNPDLHTTLPPSYVTPSYPTCQLQSAAYLLVFYFVLAKHFTSSQNLNLYLSTKAIYFLVKLLLLDETLPLEETFLFPS